MSGELAIALTAALILLAVAAVVLAVRTRRVVATPTERAVHAALHTASLAARALRRGLDADSAETAAPFLRGLTGTDGLALYGGDGQQLLRRLVARRGPQGVIGLETVEPAGVGQQILQGDPLGVGHGRRPTLKSVGQG